MYFAWLLFWLTVTAEACCNDIETVRILSQTCPGIELLKAEQ